MDLVKISPKKPLKTPKSKMLDFEHRFGATYKGLADKYGETYNTIYGRIYRRRKKQQ